MLNATNCSFTCNKCGEVGSFRSQEDFVPQIWLKCEKSIHKRYKWFENKLREDISQKYFKIMIVDTMKQQNLIKGHNLSRQLLYHQNS